MIPNISEAKGIIRKDLLAKCDASHPPHVILIQAPSGYGKTVLAGQLAQHIGKTVIWQFVDTWQRDIVTLTSQAYQNIREAFGLVQDNTETIPSDGQPAAHFLVQLLEEAKHPWVYVLDDIHQLLQHPAALIWLQTLLDHAVSGCFILVGQQLPTINLLQNIARGQVVGYGLEDLKFTHEETTELLRQFNMPQNLRAEELVSQFDGWISGIRMILQPLPEDVSSSLQQAETPEQLFKQLAEKHFRSQSPDMQDFLLKTAILEHFSLADCYQALQLQSAQLHLEQALEQNLFLEKHQQGFYYHALFREFLQQTFKNDFPASYYALQRQIADYYNSQSNNALAISHYIAGKSPVEAAVIAEQVAVPYHVQGKWQAILSFIAWLQEEDISAPNLWLMGAIIETDNYRFSMASNLLLRAEAEYKTIQNSEGIARIQAQRAFLALRQGKLAEALRLCEDLLEVSDLPDAILAWILRVQGTVLIELGQHETAIDTLESAYNFAQDKNHLAMILQDLSSAYIFSGRLDAASQILQDLVAIRRQMNEPFYLALALNSLGYHYHCCSEYKLAQTTLAEGLSILSGFSHHRVQSSLLWSMGDLHRDCGRWQAAEQSYQSALQGNIEQDIALQAGVLISLAHLRIWQQRWEDVLPILRDAEQYIVDTPHHRLRTIIKILRNIVLDTLYEPPEALNELQKDIEELSRLNVPIKLSQVLGMYFWVGLRHLNTRILHHAEQLLAELHAKAPLQAIAADIVYIPQLGYYFESRKSEFPSLTKAVKQLAQVGDRTVLVSQRKFEINHLDIQTLGDFCLIVDGRLVPQRLWVASTARELFLYLYFHGSQRREHLALLFWPDMTASRVRSNFHTTLYRAREALGNNVICFENDAYFINPEIEITCDAQRIREMLEQARPLSTRNAHAEDLYWRARQLYQGIFLPDMDRDWVLPLREQFERLYLESLTGLAKCAQARQDFSQATQYYQDAIQKAPFDETLYQGLMTCLAKLGDKQRLLNAYTQLSTVLSEELAIEPSKPSYTLFCQLLHQ